MDSENRFDKIIKKIEIISLSLVVVFSIAGGAVFGFITAEIKNYSGIHNLKSFQPNIPTRLYDVNGELIAELFQEKRDLVSFEQLPACLINAFIASEDRDFFHHFGIDPPAIGRAMVKNVIASGKSGRITVVQGGSTITQQLAKRLFTASDRTLARKVLEAVLALQIEKKFSKEEILEMYFNQIYLGHGCHGISTAANFFFNKEVRQLSVIESSVLAALPSKPDGFSPIKYPLESFNKNKDTLNRMAEAGFVRRDNIGKLMEDFWPGFIDSIKTEFPTKTAFTKNIDNAPYFTDYVRQILVSRFGKDVVYNEGLSIYTTLNLKRQSAGQKYLEEGVAKQEEVSSRANQYYNLAVDRGLIGAYGTLSMFFNLSGVLIVNDVETMFKKQMADETADALDILSLLVDAPAANNFIESFRNTISAISSSLSVQGAFIAIEPKTGYITTMVGGPEFNVSNQFNRAVQARRQPGSSFKPFIYGAGIESKKINTGTALPDAPIVDIDAQGDSWAPGNYEGDYKGMIPLSYALSASVNIISVRIFDIVGPDKIISYASKMLKVPETRFTPSPSLALGTTEVTPYEMANGYAIYANRGRDVIPFAVRYVVDRDGNELVNIEEEVGNIIAKKEMNGEIQVISPEVAWIMTNLMQGVVDRGTAAESIRANVGFTKQAAGKTGTTSNWTDAWFCGFTADISAVAWIGYDRQFMSLGKHQAGASVAAPIWGNYMKYVYNGMDDPYFPPKPEGVTGAGYCAYTGLIPGPSCTKISSGWGLKGSGLVNKTCDGNHYMMKSVLDLYMQKEGLKQDD